MSPVAWCVLGSGTGLVAAVASFGTCSPLAPRVPRAIYMRVVETHIKLTLLVAFEQCRGGDKDIGSHIPYGNVVAEDVTEASGLKW